LPLLVINRIEFWEFDRGKLKIFCWSRFEKCRSKSNRNNLPIIRSKLEQQFVENKLSLKCHWSRQVGMVWNTLTAVNSLSGACPRSRDSNWIDRWFCKYIEWISDIFEFCSIKSWIDEEFSGNWSFRKLNIFANWKIIYS